MKDTKFLLPHFQACVAALRHEPDLIISTMALPDGDAIGLCHSLGRNPQTRAIPVMVVTARPDTETRLKALEAGVRDVMLKSTDDTLMLARVRSLIRAYNAAEEWQLRDDTSRALGFAESTVDFGPPGRTVIVGSNPITAQSWIQQLRPHLRSALTHTTPETALRDLAPGKVPDVYHTHKSTNRL